jgi:glycosyltransferase 2 family protein
MSRFWRIAALVVGGSLFAWYVVRAGPTNVWATAARLGWSAPLVLLPYLVVYLVDCQAWARTLPRNDISFFTLLRIRWAGESVNNLIPSVYIGGEAVKVGLLRNHGVDAREGAAAAIVSKTAQSVAQFCFVLTAAVVLLEMAQGGWPVRAGLAFVLGGGIVAIATLFCIQKYGVFRMLVGVLDAIRCRWHFLELRRNRLLQLDDTIVGFYKSEPRRFLAATALYLGGWMLDTVEIYLVATLLGVPIAWPQAFVAEAFTGVAKALGMWIPGSLGVQESGIVLVGRLVGLPDAFNATYALIRRARELLFAAVGLGLLYADGSLRTTRAVDSITLSSK